MIHKSFGGYGSESGIAYSLAHLAQFTILVRFLTTRRFFDPMKPSFELCTFSENHAEAAVNTELPNADSCWSQERLHRLAMVSERACAEPVDLLSNPRVWISIVSSRLGHDVSHHRHVSRFLSRAMLDCNRRNGVALIAIGSAIEPLATRAAELFRVPVLRVGVGLEGSSRLDSVDLTIHADHDEKLDRDQIAIMLADRVDVLHARRGGKIAQYAEQRIAGLRDTSTRIAISAGDDVARGLVACGGIGWHLRQPESSIETAIASSHTFESRENSLLGPGEWLVHCTRGASLPWPNETINQFRDSILLNETDDNERDAFQTLLRIVRGGKLLASCHASDRQYPVVCFSSVTHFVIKQKSQ
jgi:hypothetical protein